MVPHKGMVTWDHPHRSERLCKDMSMYTKMQQDQAAARRCARCTADTGAAQVALVAPPPWPSAGQALLPTGPHVLYSTLHPALVIDL